MRYKLILLDADDTIFDFQAGNRRAVAALMAELGLSSPTVFDEYQAINHACWQALDRGEMQQMWREVYERYYIMYIKEPKNEDCQWWLTKEEDALLAELNQEF